jgi:hypothetical protein
LKGAPTGAMDRFYPLGLPAEEDHWKTTYEAQNEMHSHERSCFPPGTSVHLPGARDKFGFSSPGPIPSRLAQSSMTLSRDVDLPNPREHLTMTRVPEPDDRKTFARYDVPEMTRSCRSPVASMTFSGMRGTMGTMSRTRSLPALEKRPAPPKLSEPSTAVENLEDDHFDYFVPQGLQSESRDRLHSGTLSRLKKVDRISFPFTGSGTGFKAQSSMTEFRLAHAVPKSDTMTTYRANHGKPAVRASSEIAFNSSFR